MGNQTKRAYRIVFAILTIGAIFNISFKDKNGFNKVFLNRATKLLIVSLMIYETVLGIRLFYIYTQYDMWISYLSFKSVSIVHRCNIMQNFNKLKRTAYTLGKLEIGEGAANINRWIYIFASFIGATHTVYFICIAFQFSGNSEFLGISLVGTPMFLYYLLLLLNSLATVLLVLLPISSFALLYVFLCQQLRYAIQHHARLLPARSLVEYEGIRHSYQKLMKIIANTDNQVSFLMLCEAVISSSIMYYAISSPCRAPVYTTSYKITKITFFLNTLVCFIFMAVFAISVTDESSKLISKSHERNEFLSYSRGMCLCLNPEVCLTVWKITPINRKFLMAFMGTVFSYVVIFDSLFNK